MTKTGALCPDCGADLVERRTKGRGRIFYGCSRYPECKFLVTEKPMPYPCPHCGGLVVQKTAKSEPTCRACGQPAPAPVEAASAREPAGAASA